MKNAFERTKKIITQSMNIGENVLMDSPLIEFEGKKSLRIENHKGIVKYTSEEIMINTTLGTAVISGEGMSIFSLIKEEVIIKGIIYGVRYML